MDARFGGHPWLNAKLVQLRRLAAAAAKDLMPQAPEEQDGAPDTSPAESDGLENGKTAPVPELVDAAFQTAYQGPELAHTGDRSCCMLPSASPGLGAAASQLLS